MNAGLLRLAALAACAATGSATAGEQGPRKPPAASRLLEPCDVPGVPGKARCGTYEVYENRDTRIGRKISLKIVVVPATDSERLSDPYVFLNGGPGESSTEAAGASRNGVRKAPRAARHSPRRSTGHGGLASPQLRDVCSRGQPAELSRLLLSSCRGSAVPGGAREEHGSHSLHDVDRDGRPGRCAGGSWLRPFKPRWRLESADVDALGFKPERLLRRSATPLWPMPDGILSVNGRDFEYQVEFESFLKGRKKDLRTAF